MLLIPQFPLAPFVRSYFEDHLVCRRNASPHTVQSYRDALKLFLRFTAVRLKKPATRLLVTDVSEGIVASFLADLEQTRANSIQTRNHRLVALRNVFAYIASREVLLLEHCRRLVDFPRKRGAAVPEIRYLEKEQMNAILAAVCRDTAAGRRDYALLLFMYNTGARVQEAADGAAGVADVDAAVQGRITGQGPQVANVPSLGKHGPAVEATHHGTAAEAWAGRVPLFEPLRSPLQPIGHCRPPGTPSRQGQHCDAGTASAPDHPSYAAAHDGHAPAAIWRRTQRDPQRPGHASTTTTNGYIEIDLTMKRKALEACEVAGSKKADPIWQSRPDILSWLDSL